MRNIILNYFDISISSNDLNVNNLEHPYSQRLVVQSLVEIGSVVLKRCFQI